MTFHHLIEIAFRLNDILVNGISSRLKLHFVEMDSGKNFLLDAVSFKLHFGMPFKSFKWHFPLGFFNLYFLRRYQIMAIL